jgi:hypothetical protein
MRQKREVLNGIAAALRAIVGKPAKQAKTEMPVAA